MSLTSCSENRWNGSFRILYFRGLIIWCKIVDCVDRVFIAERALLHAYHFLLAIGDRRN
jgi:hypothetical protein